MTLAFPRRRALALLAALAVSPLLQAHDAAAPPLPHIGAFDNHLDIPFDFALDAQGALAGSAGQFDLVKAEAGGLKGGVLAVFVPQAARTPEGIKETAAKAQQKLQLITGIATAFPERAAVADSPEAFAAIQASGRFAIVLGILNGQFIGHDVDQIDAWHAQGVRVFGLTHNGNNDLADSSRPYLLRGDRLGEHGGLSPLGKAVVARLNALGMVIDVSQLSGAALEQVLALSQAPVVASHSNARAIIDHPRNLDDAQLQAVKRNGGVVAVNAYSSWVRPLPAEAIARLGDIRRSYGVPVEPVMNGVQPISEAGVTVLPADVFARYSHDFHEVTADPAYRATLEEYVNQIDYVVRAIGIDHVGISSDFNHGGGVIGWNDASETGNVTAELQRRGYSASDIAKLWGGNFLRVWADAQAKAQP